MNKILVVDDNPDILVVVQLVLEIRGFTVKTLLKGEEVEQMIKEFNPDVLLLDVMLGSTSGITICKSLKENPETKHLCIIMFSAHGKKEDILKLCPANAFVSKPFDVHALAETIHEQMGKC